ncbi:response regulator [Catenovulum sp. SM1970]|uniref:ATP-binding protein n=1 Tax=Marinifaba aquimaris TaxID=2741323 RepID=UPI0015739CC3|nr:ATP-binding protein [Marinifaba aquimaris]NTS78793.1 response regulator [Marinifaba aquimaris]
MSKTALDTDSKLNKPLKYDPIKNQLSRWFLAVAILPLLATGTAFYYHIDKTLTHDAINRLISHSAERTKFIDNWFEYRFMDLHRLSHSPVTTELLEKLIAEYQSSKLPLNKFVQSLNWEKTIREQKQFFNNQWQSYDYIYDIFLIDAYGNILFSIAKEDDLGTNILNGKFSNTRFSQVVKQAYITGAPSFSDLERYAASNGVLSGFIAAPIINDNGHKIGTLAIQLRLNRILKIDESTSYDKHWLVGADNKYRTPIDDFSEVLTSSVKRARESERLEHDLKLASQAVYLTTGVHDKPAFTIYTPIKLANVNWLLISQIDKDLALENLQTLMKIALVIIITSIALIYLFIIKISRKLTAPVQELTKAALKVSKGDLSFNLIEQPNNELGTLAQVFEIMTKARANHEQELAAKNIKIEANLKQMQQQSEKLSLILKSTAIGVWDWEVETGKTQFNERWAEIIGYTLDELAPVDINTWLKHSHPEDLEKSNKALNKHWAGLEEYYVCEARMRHKDGHYVWILDTGKVVEWYENGKPKRMIGTHLDVTEQKRTERALLEAIEDAEAGAKAKSEFLASMSHEIRTPMNGVLGMLDIIKRGELNTEQKKYVDIAQSSAESLLTLINDILDYSKVEAGKIDIEAIDFNFHSLMNELVHAIAPKANEKGLEVIVDTNNVEFEIVNGDPTRLKQILNNLISNAIKFTEKGEIFIRAGIKKEGDNLKLSVLVKDSGIGIPFKKQAKIFESFTQADTSTTRKYGGTGLGLSIVKKLCRLMGGDISVGSKPGKGSSFNININLAATQDNDIRTISQSCKNVLILDTNITNLTVLEKAFRNWEANVFSTNQHELAKEYLSTEEIDLLLIEKSKIDAQLIEQIRIKKPTTIVMSQISCKSITEQQDLETNTIIINKPVMHTELVNVLNSLNAEPSTNTTSVKVKPMLNNGSEKNWTRKHKVLIVEDNHVNQLITQTILNEIGVENEVAENGVVAIEKLSQTKQDQLFDLVLMDCQMPEMDGYQATKAIREGVAKQENQEIKIVAMTANAMVGDEEKCLASGMNDYLTKPIDKARLVNKLNKWLEAY